MQATLPTIPSLPHTGVGVGCEHRMKIGEISVLCGGNQREQSCQTLAVAPGRGAMADF